MYRTTFKDVLKAKKFGKQVGYWSYDKGDGRLMNSWTKFNSTTLTGQQFLLYCSSEVLTGQCDILCWNCENLDLESVI